ncbi:putative peptidase [Sterolibacterium denitrificans]|uniref:Protease n=2 Tax=Sterolibacterium denitrificans TaxID=157592 RepID=A0A656Z8P9_9PROT|nr:U32 family peptidase [Sterolibacterium denitrificans]KYC29369.1 protease [Sterolibacterium denitrificans]SMB31121.1 putative peptidase [Sterolibacterium denitrificans]
MNPTPAANRRSLELLAPAKNLEYGIAAIDHGADAVYIGGPAFGARHGAGNGVAEIARLTRYAHRFDARVLVALNTILTDDELSEAERLIHELHAAEVDALIIQDMGLLELDLPPIQLHASTQCDIRTSAKARFLQDVGFSQMVLARELNLQQIRAIAAQTEAVLEFFIHGALCVAYSGQCYISHAHTGRSANRGECSQACRLPYTLQGPDGTLIAQDKHLLSMKDNDQSANLRALIEAGIRSFKIEGRLKDLSYVKNITAHYRQLLDGILDELPADAGYRRASSGRSTYTFTPRPAKTFNRGATDYFLQGRQADIGAFDSPKFAGPAIGQVTAVGERHFDVALPHDAEEGSQEELHNGDGLSYYTADGVLAGLRVNRVDGARVHVAEAIDRLAVGTTLYRNRDQAFERLLAGHSAERRIAVRMRLEQNAAGLRLTLADETGISGSATLEHALTPAREAGTALAALRKGLSKLGETIYRLRDATDLHIDLATPCFLPAASINTLRRTAAADLDQARAAAWQRPPRAPEISPPPVYPERELSYLGNVLNARARDFYARHGVAVIAKAYESNREQGEVSLMITKHCLRYSYNLCPKQVKGIRPEPMTLIQGRDRLTLRFDCKPCEMHVIGPSRQPDNARSIPILPHAEQRNR